MPASSGLRPLYVKDAAMFEMTAVCAFAKAPPARDLRAAPPASPLADRPAPLLAAALDEIDYGLLLADADGHVLHLNDAALAELDVDHPLQLLGQRLRARCSADVAPLFDALQDACLRGLRRTVSLGEGAHLVSLAVVPLAVGAPGAQGRPALLLLGRPRADSACMGVRRLALLPPMGGAPRRQPSLYRLVP